MLDVAAVREGLSVAGLAFGTPVSPPATLRWGPLFAALDGLDDQDYVTAVELIYEGYLFHYRESRVSAVPADAPDTALLAGDFFYARGLRLIAARGDAEAVGLLARLMAACSHLRSVGAAFAADDALWAYSMAGLAALRGRTPAATVNALFERFDAEVAGGADVHVGDMVQSAAHGLGLRDEAPLRQVLSGDEVTAPFENVAPCDPVAASAGLPAP